MPPRNEPARLWAPWRMSYIEGATDGTQRSSKAGPQGGSKAGVPRGGERRTRGASNSRATPDSEPCLFCRVAHVRHDQADLVLARRPHALLMLNRYPYNPGHLMVAVRAHKAQFTELTPAEHRDLMSLVALAERALAAEYRPHGMNYGANLGRVAGAGFPGHLHLHLVPRWDGDTNFMPVVGATKVLPEALEQTWTRLRRAVRANARPGAARRGAPR